MKLLNVVMLTVSGALIYASVLLPKIGLKNSTLSHYPATLLSGIGVGIGVGFFIFFGVSSGDLFGSTFTGVIAAFIAGLVFHFYNNN